ncbi:MAG TPA: hypothetical protein PKW66_19525, partial [Polyangiaceae bacterium]|nr:hypothetical protein [Polyangiaceae bacterium]
QKHDENEKKTGKDVDDAQDRLKHDCAGLYDSRSGCATTIVSSRRSRDSIEHPRGLSSVFLGFEDEQKRLESSG